MTNDIVEPYRGLPSGKTTILAFRNTRAPTSPTSDPFNENELALNLAYEELERLRKEVINRDATIKNAYDFAEQVNDGLTDEDMAHSVHCMVALLATLDHASPTEKSE